MRRLMTGIVLLTLLLTGCNEGHISERLTTVDSLLSTEQNDSAYQMLLSIGENRISDKADRAYYNLLMTRARYIINKPLDSDSLLDEALDYFELHKDNERIADCYYYKGYRMVLSHNLDSATLYYKKAENLSMNTKDLHLKFKILQSLSAINTISGNSQMQLGYAKRMERIAIEADNKRWLAFAYYDIGLAFSQMSQTDSAIYYINKVEPLIRYIHQKDLPDFLTNIAYLYKHSHPERAKEYYLKAISEKENSYALEHLADIYYAEGQQEKAYQIWERALVISDSNPKDNIIHNLLEYDVEHGRIDEVCQRVNDIIAIKDSIINSLKNNTIRDLQTRFDHHVEMNAVNERLIHWQRALGGIFLLALCMTAYILWRKHKNRLQRIEYKMHTGILSRKIAELEASVAKAKANISEMKLADSQNQQKILNLEANKAEAENLVRLLKGDKTKNQQKIEELEKEISIAEQQIATLKDAQERSQQKIAELDQARLLGQSETLPLEENIGILQGKEIQKIRKGFVLYDDVTRNKKVIKWGPEDYQTFIDYYEIAHSETLNKHRKTYGDITHRNMLYLILVDMGKTNEEICHIMSLGKVGIRSIRFRLNNSKKK